MLRETTSRGLSRLVCPSRKRGGGTREEPGTLKQGAPVMVFPGPRLSIQTSDSRLRPHRVIRGPAAMGLLKQLMIFGKSGLQGLPTRVALPLRDIQLRLSKGATGSPYLYFVHNMGLCSRPGEDANAWKQSGPDDPGNRASA